MSFEEQLTRAFDTLSERLRGDIADEVERRTADAIAAMPAPEPPAAPAAAAAPLGDDTQARERLTAAFDAIDRARSLTDVLDALLDAARAEAGAAQLWLRRGDRLHAWRSPGGLEAAGTETPPAIEDGVALTISGQTVAVLVTDSELAAQNPEPGTANAERRTSNAEPRTSNAEPRTSNAEPPTSNAERRTSNLSLLARYASRSLEALTAFKTVRALTHRAQAGGGPTPTGEEPPSDEDIAARRYARLLVSEIKLYHEPAVIEGRRDRDLAGRLGGEITRARVLYEQRVPAHVRARADYFHDELVRTLADGDASLLSST
jgi:hypothetical protein